MAFAGTLVNRGRGRGVVVGTALNTQLGRIAAVVLGKRTAKAPLLVRMERFTHWVAILVAVAAMLMAGVALTRGMPLNEVFLLAVALAIGMQRMARRNVIVRRLVAVEALGSCTYIATDKTGTLTENQLTVRRIAFPICDEWEVRGEGLEPKGAIVTPRGAPTLEEQGLLNSGYTVDEARNGTLLLMVLFENVHVFNSRSETRSAFRHSPLRNPLLLFGTAAAQLVHIGAMYTPWISDVLHIQPVSPQHWLELLGMALTVLLAMEIHKAVRRHFGFDAKNGA